MQPTRVGLSEVLLNRSREQVFIRGYAFSPSGPVALRFAWEDGTPFEPTTTRDTRQDVARKFDDCPDPACGFTFHVPLPGGVPPFHGRVHAEGPGGPSIGQDVTVASTTATFDSDLVVDRIDLSWFGQHLRIRAKLIGPGEPEVEAVLVDGVAVRMPRKALPSPRRKPEIAGRTRVEILAPLTQVIAGAPFQVFLGAGSVITLVMRRPGSDYHYSVSHTLPAVLPVTGLGQISSLRYDAASQLLEVTGAFFGHFGPARVRIAINGVEQKRAASVRAAPGEAVGLEAASDAPLCHWVWCDTVPLPAEGSLAVEAKAGDGTQVFADVAEHWAIAKIPQSDAPLSPSYHVSPLRESFDAMLAEAIPTSADPTIAFVFPGDMSRAFGGGPTRLRAMGQYFRTMGFRTVLIDRSAEEAPTVELTPAIAEGFDVRLGVPERNLEEMCALCLDEAGAGDTGDVISHALGRALAEARVHNAADLITRRTDRRFDAIAAFLLSRLRPDVVITSFAWTAGVLELLPQSVCRILDTVDIQYRRGELHRAMFNDESMRSDREVELAAWSAADYLIAIQPDEKEEIIAASGRNNVILSGHGVTNVREERLGEPAPVVLFVGNNYAPNIEGITRFIREVWPQVHARKPEARLQIVGTVGEAVTEVADGVEILGLVNDLQQVYDSAAVVINPVGIGTGVSIKLIEALCNGLATVTTPVGVRGLPGADDAVIVADVPGMADAILDLLGSTTRRRALEAAALRFARAELSPDKAFRELFNTIELRIYS